MTSAKCTPAERIEEVLRQTRDGIAESERRDKVVADQFASMLSARYAQGADPFDTYLSVLNVAVSMMMAAPTPERAIHYKLAIKMMGRFYGRTGKAGRVLNEKLCRKIEVLARMAARRQGRCRPHYRGDECPAHGGLQESGGNRGEA